MNAIVSAQAQTAETQISNQLLTRKAVYGDSPLTFTDIYQEDINIAVWQRNLSTPLQTAVSEFVSANPTFKKAMILAPKDMSIAINDMLNSADYPQLTDNIAELVDMFCCLFELKRAGLRLTTLDKAMCPKFHVDRVPCRLVTTYQGVATQWLPHHLINREKLGARNPQANQNSKNTAPLFQNEQDIEQLNTGDVALLKGETWEGNENAGLVHRSPALTAGEHRLLLTLDFAD